MRVLGSSEHKYDYSKFPELPSSQTLGVSLQFARTYSKTRNFEKPFVPPPFKLLPLQRAVSVIITPVCRSSRVHKSRYLIFPFYKKASSRRLSPRNLGRFCLPLFCGRRSFFSIKNTGIEANCTKLIAINVTLHGCGISRWLPWRDTRLRVHASHIRT